MENNLLINGKPLEGSLEGLLAVELHLKENYLFRRNVLNGKVEFADKPAENQEAKWKMLTQSALQFGRDEPHWRASSPGIYHHHRLL